MVAHPQILLNTQHRSGPEMRTQRKNGTIALGTPIGHEEFIEQWTQYRIDREEIMPRHLPEFEDPQISWVLLSQSAVQPTRSVFCRQTIRTTTYDTHDRRIWET